MFNYENLSPLPKFRTPGTQAKITFTQLKKPSNINKRTNDNYHFKTKQQKIKEKKNSNSESVLVLFSNNLQFWQDYQRIKHDTQCWTAKPEIRQRTANNEAPDSVLHFLFYAIFFLFYKYYVYSYVYKQEEVV